MRARTLCKAPKTMPTIFTIGHSTRTIEEFVALLRQVVVDLLVDVRSIPRSRTNPQFNADALPEALWTQASPTVIWRPLADYGTGTRERCHRPIRSGGSPPSGTMPITRQLRRFERDWPNCERSPVTIAALLCAPKLCGGAATAASSPTICWRKEFRCHTHGAQQDRPAKFTPGKSGLPGGTLLYPAAEEAQIKAID